MTETIKQQKENSRENELGLIGAVMRDGKIFDRAREIVNADDFDWQCYGWVWQACETLFTGGMYIDVITVGDELERQNRINDFQIPGGYYKGRDALGKIRENGDPRHFMSYAENVQDYSAKRKILGFLQQGAKWAVNGRRANHIMEDLSKSFAGIEIYGSKNEYTVPIATAVSEAYDWTDRAAKGEMVGVKTGFADIDRILTALIAGNVYIIAGRPGGGKTAFLLTIARNAALANKRVGILSLEMSRLQVAQRLIAQDAQIDLQNIISGKLEEREWALYTNAVENVATYPIIINDLSSITISQIRQVARKIKSEGGLDLLILDYVQLAGNELGDRFERRELEVSKISRGLKHLARELDVPIFAAAQLNRAVEQRGDKRPVLSDLRESGSLEQDAYCVMFIHRTEKDNVSEIIIAKHRNGPVGSVEVVFRNQYAAFASMARR
jgi:replicative DNA helicase